MRKQLFAILMALALSIGMTAPVAAIDPQADDPGGGGGGAAVVMNGKGVLARYGSGYRYHIPVCIDPSFWGQGSGWDLTIPQHAAANRALHNWDDIGGELYFYRTDTSCSSLVNSNIVHVALAREYAGSTADPAWMDINRFQTVCAEPWGLACFYRGIVWINRDQSWYSGAAQTPGPDRYDLEHVITHEIGHIVGIEDQYDPNTLPSIMWHGLGKGEKGRDPAQNDKDGYALNYGTEHCNENVNQHPC